MSLASLLLVALVSGQPVPVACVGGAAARQINLIYLDQAGSELGRETAEVEDGKINPRLPTAAQRLRASAPNYAPAELTRAQLRFGITLEALATVEIPLRDSGVGQFFGILDKPGGGIERALGRLIAGRLEFLVAPGAPRVFLLDDSRSEPAIVELPALKPAERRRLSSATFRPGRVERVMVKGPESKPVVGAKVLWVIDSTDPSDRLLANWMAARAGTTGQGGQVAIDRLPARSHTWAVSAPGFRDGRVSVEKQSLVASVTLAPLPRIRVSVISDEQLKAPVDLTAKRVVALNQDNAEAILKQGWPVVWRGRLVGEEARDFPISDPGLYRVEASSDRQFASGEVAVDSVETAAEVIPLSVRFGRRSVSGHIKMGDRALSGIKVQAFPWEKTGGLTPPLATCETDEGGSYAVEFHHAGIVKILATIDSGDSSQRQVDLTDHASADDVDFLFDRGSVRVRVLARDSGNLIPGSTVFYKFNSATKPGGRQTSRQTPSGELVIGNPNRGSLVIRAEADGYAAIARTLQVSDSEQSEVEVRLPLAGAFRIRLQDQNGYPVPNAAILSATNLYLVSQPRRVPLTQLGTADSQGMFVLDRLPGLAIPVFAVAPGYTIAFGNLPVSADPSADDDRNTLTLTLSIFNPGPPLRIVGPDNRPRLDAAPLFIGDGIEIPTGVLAKAATGNGISVRVVLATDAAGETHVPDLLPPGSYLVQGLSPGSATADTRDNLGMVALPLERATTLVWKEDRRTFFQR